MDPILYETHMHTPLCKHARGEPSEYARAAKIRGLKGIIVTDHCPMPDGISESIRMAEDEFDDYLQWVLDSQEGWKGHVDIRLGLESEYLPGTEKWIEKLHQRADFDFILGSVHPHMHEYRKKYFDGDWTEFHRLYYQHLAEAAETGLYDSLAHPDIVKNMGFDEWEVDDLMPDICEALDRIVRTGVAMELNTSGLNKKVPEMNPGIEILREMKKRDIPITLGADAHIPERVADKFEAALDSLIEVGYQHVSIFLERKRIEIPISQARFSLIDD